MIPALMNLSVPQVLALNEVDWHLLTVRREPGGERHYIGEHGLHAGDFIRAFVGGEWVDGRYESVWSWEGNVRRLSAAAFHSNGSVVHLPADRPVAL